jgi:hypothetical protein
VSLRWSGSIEAQKQADAAYKQLKDKAKPNKSRAYKRQQKRFRKAKRQREEIARILLGATTSEISFGPGESAPIPESFKKP